jgi:hypothetical protein
LRATCITARTGHGVLSLSASKPVIACPTTGL